MQSNAMHQQMNKEHFINMVRALKQANERCNAMQHIDKDILRVNTPNMSFLLHFGIAGTAAIITVAAI